MVTEPRTNMVTESTILWRPTKFQNVAHITSPDISLLRPRTVRIAVENKNANDSADDNRLLRMKPFLALLDEGRLLGDVSVREGPLISSAYTGQIFSAQTGHSLLRETAIFSVVLSDRDVDSSTAGSVFRTT